jgi:nucleoside-diphosphate-sugar epimerase
MTALVTGGSGCIGSYVLRDLLRGDHAVINYDLDPDRSILRQVIDPEMLELIRTVQGDITDFPQLCRTVKEHKVDVIVHLASWQIPASNANPSRALSVVSGGLVNVLEAARLFNIRRVVWSSSIAVFGPASEYGNRKVNNDACHRPQSVYGACKSLGEFLLHYYYTQYKVDSIGLRFSAVYGIGRERGLSSFTTEMIRQTAAGEPYEVPFGDDTIDWQYVEDVSEIILRSIEVDSTKTRVFNTRGDVRPVRSGVDYLRTLLPDAQLTVKPGTFGIAWEYDTTPLETELGFVPGVIMEEGILKTLNGYLKQKGKDPVVV